MTSQVAAIDVEKMGEKERLETLDALNILDTPPEATFDDLAWLTGFPNRATRTTELDRSIASAHMSKERFIARLAGDVCGEAG